MFYSLPIVGYRCNGYRLGWRTLEYFFNPYIITVYKNDFTLDWGHITPYPHLSYTLSISVLYTYIIRYTHLYTADFNCQWLTNIFTLHLYSRWASSCFRHGQPATFQRGMNTGRLVNIQLAALRKRGYKSKVTLAIAWEQMHTPPSSSVLCPTVWMHTARQRKRIHSALLYSFRIILKNYRTDTTIHLIFSLLRCQETMLSFAFYNPVPSSSLLIFHPFLISCPFFLLYVP